MAARAKKAPESPVPETSAFDRVVSEIVANLEQPFPPGEVKWRIGSTNREKTRGMALAYIDARNVMERLDQVVGPAQWKDELVVSGDVFICTLSLYLPTLDGTFQWVSKSDAAGATDFEAAKGGASDAFKRAAVKWGIGRYLYAMEAPWVEIEVRGKTSHIAKHELQRLQGEATRRGNGAGTPKAEPRSEKDSGRAGDGLLDDAQMKEAYQLNWKSWEFVGKTWDEYKTMTGAEKYAPLDSAVKKLGVARLDQVEAKQFDELKKGLRAWCAANKS